MLGILDQNTSKQLEIYRFYSDTKGPPCSQSSQGQKENHVLTQMSVCLCLCL